MYIYQICNFARGNLQIQIDKINLHNLEGISYKTLLSLFQRKKAWFIATRLKPIEWYSLLYESPWQVKDELIENQKQKRDVCGYGDLLAEAGQDSM